MWPTWSPNTLEFRARGPAPAGFPVLLLLPRAVGPELWRWGGGPPAGGAYNRQGSCCQVPRPGPVNWGRCCTGEPDRRDTSRMTARPDAGDIVAALECRFSTMNAAIEVFARSGGRGADPARPHCPHCLTGRRGSGRQDAYAGQLFRAAHPRRRAIDWRSGGRRVQQSRARRGAALSGA